MRLAKDGWMIETGQHQRNRSGRPLPEWYLKRPHEVRGDEVYLRAYARLSTERRDFGQQVGPIPWTAIDAYGRRYGFGAEMHEFFVDVMLLLDQSYREHLANKSDDEQRKQQKSTDREAKRAAKKW